MARAARIESPAKGRRARRDENDDSEPGGDARARLGAGVGADRRAVRRGRDLRFASRAKLVRRGPRGRGGSGALAAGAARRLAGHADSPRRRGFRDLRLPAQRLARLLAIGGAVGRRAAFQRRGRGDRLRHLPRRDARGADRRLSRAAPDRGGRPRRDPVSVQSRRHVGRGLAYGGIGRAGRARASRRRFRPRFSSAASWFSSSSAKSGSKSCRWRVSAVWRGRRNCMDCCWRSRRSARRRRFWPISPRPSPRRCRRSASARCSPRSRRRVCGDRSISPPASRSTRSPGGRRASSRP